MEAGSSESSASSAWKSSANKSNALASSPTLFSNGLPPDFFSQSSICHLRGLAARPAGNLRQIAHRFRERDGRHGAERDDALVPLSGWFVVGVAADLNAAVLHEQDCP